jgi:hypothetical protein
MAKVFLERKVFMCWASSNEQCIRDPFGKKEQADENAAEAFIVMQAAVRGQQVQVQLEQDKAVLAMLFPDLKPEALPNGAWVCSVWKLPEPKFTIQKARGILKPIGVNLTRDSGTKEFIVSPNIATPTWSGSTIADKPIYHTDDLRDAVLTGAAMVFGVGTLAFHEWVDHHGI